MCLVHDWPYTPAFTHSCWRTPLVSLAKTNLPNSTDHCSKPCFVTWNSPLYIGLYEIIPQLIINLPGLPNPKLHHVPFLHFCQTPMPLGLDTPATAASPVLFHAQNLGTAAGRRLWSLSFPSSWESVAIILSNIALANPWAKIIQNPSLGLQKLVSLSSIYLFIPCILSIYAIFPIISPISHYIISIWSILSYLSYHI